MQKYLESVAELCEVPITEISQMAQGELVRRYILPCAIRAHNNFRRPPYISDKFMAFMAQYAAFCWQLDPITGQVLCQIAMQRISHGGVQAEFYYLSAWLPQEFRKYDVSYDEPTPLTPECWHFMEKNMRMLLLEGGTCEHARDIILSLLENTSPTGETLNELTIPETKGVPSVKALFNWAMDYASNFYLIPYEVTFRRLSKPESWQRYIVYWVEIWHKLSRKEQKLFYRRIGATNVWKQFKVKYLLWRYSK